MSELREPIELTKRGSDEIVAFACATCHIVAASTKGFGGDIEAARKAASRHCGPFECATCGAHVRNAYDTACGACSFERDRVREEAQFAKATPIDPETYTGMVFDPSTRLGDEGFCGSYEEAVQEAHDLDSEDGEVPYVYACVPEGFGTIDAYDLVSNHLEHEEHSQDAYEQVIDLDELNAFLKTWCAKQTAVVSWWPDYSRVLMISPCPELPHEATPSTDA
jgi:hypothetical protein